MGRLRGMGRHNPKLVRGGGLGRRGMGLDCWAVVVGEVVGEVGEAPAVMVGPYE